MTAERCFETPAWYMLSQFPDASSFKSGMQGLGGISFMFLATKMYGIRIDFYSVGDGPTTKFFFPLRNWSLAAMFSALYKLHLLT